MGLLDRLTSLFSSRPSREADDAIHIYVECGRCKSRVHARLDKRHDLSQGEGGGFFVRKEIMDSKCFRLMAAEIVFDGGYRIQSQNLDGGRFISKEEFEAATASEGAPDRPGKPS
ncbi:MAG TPA: hypothetical protein VJP78_02260 [Thermoleophilia bacterium]|nr:hypothetical protein [Thermoleophilia bacterium]